jgi:photosystem II stability/assembly factor-like uncharacterized protein
MSAPRSRVALLVALPFVFLAPVAPVVPHPPAAAQSGRVLEAADWAHLEWRNIGPGAYGGRIVDFAVQPDDVDVMYAAVSQGGAWKSINGGITWLPVFEQEGSGAAGGIAVAPSNPNVVWVGTGEANGRNLVSTSWGDGVYKSEDGGKSWTHMGLELSEQIGRIRIHPEDQDTVYVTVVGSLYHHDEERNAARGLWRTTDGGASWEKILDAGEHGGFVDLELDPRDPDLMYAASWQRERSEWRWLPRGDESGLWRSTDGGDTWERLANGLPQTDVGRVGVSICRSRPDTVYSIFEGPDGGVYRSEDRGASWELRNEDITGSHWYAQIRCDPNEPERVYAPQTQMMVSHDGGRTFDNEMAGKPVHVDHHALWIDPADSDHLLLGNDGGIYLSRDRGETWRFVDMSITQYFEIGVGMQEPFYWVCGGTQDNNSMCGPSATRHEDGIVNDDWFVTTGGDGFYARTDPTDSTIVYSESQNGGIIRLDTLTGERKRIRPVDPQDLVAPGDQPEHGIDEFRWNWSAPILISHWDPSTVYFGAQVLLRSPDRGDTWEIASPDLTRALTYDNQMNDFGTVRVIAESPLRRGLLAVGTDDGLIQISEDDGASWRAVDGMPGVPEMALVRRLVLSAHYADTMYAASSSHEYGDYTPYISKSTDLGRTWVSIAGNLPDGSPVRSFAEHPRNAAVLFAGTEHGVWASLDGGERWVSLKNNLPTVAVHDMVVHPRDNDLVIGTHGRGIWILDNINVIEGLSGEVLAAPAHVFATRPTLQFNAFDRGRGWRGDDYFRAPNPPWGALLDVWIAPDALGGVRDATRPELTIHDAAGNPVRRLELPSDNAAGGLHRLVWDLRYDPTWVAPPGQGSFGGGTVRSPWVLPGTYEVRLQLGDTVSTQAVEIVGDPLAVISDVNRRYWHDLQVALSHILATSRAASATAEMLGEVMEQSTTAIESGSGGRRYPPDVVDRIRRVSGEISAVQRALGGIAGDANSVYGALQNAISPPTRQQEQLARLAFDGLQPQLDELERLIEEEMPVISGLLDGMGAPWTLGRPVTLPDAARLPQRR